MSTAALSPSPRVWGEGWGEGRFLPEYHRTPFVPSARPGGRIEGLLPRSETSVHALARGPLARGLKVRFRLDGGLLSCQQRQESNQRSAAPMSAPNNRRAIVGSPALLGRGGRFRQAVPGLSKTASASLPRPRLRAADPPRPAMLGAARRGGTSEAESKAHQKHLVIPAQAGIQGIKLRPPQPAPHPSPLPTSGERGLKAGSRDAFDSAFDVAVAVPWTFPPSGCAEHRSSRRHRLAPVWREARQDAEAFLDRPGMACLKTPPRARSAGYRPIAEGDWSAQTPGGVSLVTFFAPKKVTRLQGGTAISISGSNSPRVGAHATVSECVLVPRYTRLRGHSGRTGFGAWSCKKRPSPQPSPHFVGRGSTELPGVSAHKT